MVGIYIIINPESKPYVGQTKNFKRRLYEYKTNLKLLKGQPKLYDSFIQYGFENHTITILEECLIEDLNTRERHYQELYNVVEEGLNCVYVATNSKSGKASEITIQKQKLAKAGKNNPMFGKTLWNKNKKLTEEHKKKQSNAHLGKQQLTETKRKIQAALKGKKYSIVVCPHCAKQGGINTMNRWHFNKCKSKKLEL